MRFIIHIDMDCFYAAVEARDNPVLRGRPLIIGSLPQERGVVSTCSYEARKFGVHSAMNIKDAYRLCPNGIFMHPNFEKYKRVSRQLYEIWENYSDIFEYVALDEGYLDVSHVNSAQYARKIAFEIKRRVRNETSLSCSVGIGYSMTSAKLASEEKKPDGFFEILTPDNFVALIIDRSVRVLYGVGEKTAEKLNNNGIFTVRDIQLNRNKVISLLGSKIGKYIADLSWGIDERVVTPYDEKDAKSIAREVTFQKDTMNRDFLKDVLMLLAVNLEARLKKLQLYARTVTLKLTYHDMKTITRSQSGENINQAYEIFTAAFNSFKNVKTNLIRLIGISLQNLSQSGTRQLTFSDINKNREKFLRQRWQQAIFNLERKYMLRLTGQENKEQLYYIIDLMLEKSLEVKNGENF
ncbi:MAG: DNA polymerase IV [Synergistales bacterium]|nr:DNA polymerase IV [Synergistales bacterium]MDY6404338.1 DNA polymerase IV [Synergistales bacterium]MDY6413898.1 DNA polymerase IV [Synergistales bacterium]MDY6422269.1 DNA polymerase IV [Synergistales bacterium]MDY6429348.1 DNA polymerase IV [Synergistales bacterium]